MTDDIFLRIFLTALELALRNDHINHGYMTLGPYWFIENEQVRNQIDLFEQKNFKRFEDLFNRVSVYFDAKSHYQNNIDNIDIDVYRKELIELIEQYKLKIKG